MDESERDLRVAIVEKARWMNASGLNQGTSGNISARSGDSDADHADGDSLRDDAARP